MDSGLQHDMPPPLLGQIGLVSHQQQQRHKQRVVVVVGAGNGDGVSFEPSTVNAKFNYT